MIEGEGKDYHCNPSKLAFRSAENESLIQAFSLYFPFLFLSCSFILSVDSLTSSTGLDFSEVKEWEEAVKSISRSGTFAEDTNDPVKIAGFLELLSESVHRALLKDRFLFKIVTLKVRFEDFSTYTRSKTIPFWTSDIFVIKRVSMQLLSEFIGRQKIRLVGVGVSRLRERDTRQSLITDFQNKLLDGNLNEINKCKMN